MSKASDRRTEGIERSRTARDQTLGQNIVDMTKYEPFRSARGAYERAEEIRMETLGMQSFAGSWACADDEVARLQSMANRWTSWAKP
jgi:hypothetical protein